MHPLHDPVAKQVSDELTARRILVWYDRPSDFAPFIAELCS